MHIPVLLEEVIGYIDPRPGRKFIDATVNGGGHAFAVLQRTEPDGKLMGIEWDPQIASNLELKANEMGLTDRLVVVNGNYINLGEYARTKGFERADGVLFDFGMSTWQLEEGERGFSFLKDEPLDMRFNPGSETAADVVNRYSEEDLADVIYKYGEERYSRRIAAEIVRHRPIMTTFGLVEAIKRALPFRARLGRIHFATRTFQALRIAVNHELDNIAIGLEQAAKIVAPGGRIAAISFHSLEDRIIKNFFREQEKNGILKVLTKKPVRAGLEEITSNPNSRSAKLRVVEII